MNHGSTGRTVFVTVGPGRLGSVDARHLAREGAQVVVLGIDYDGAQAVVEELEDLDGEGLAVECDLTDREDVAATVEAIEDRTGGVDVLVNNAGFVDAVSRLEEFPDDLWTATSTSTSRGPTT